MLKIGDFSKLSRISIRMLRHYNDIGLLVPSNIDSFTGYRYYGEDQLPLAGRINALKEMGFSLAVITQIVKHYENTEALQNYLIVKKAEIRQQAEDINRQLLLLENALKLLGKEGNTMNYNVTLKELPERYVASVRKIIPTYTDEGMLWKILVEETLPLNLKAGEPCYTLAIFHDKEYKENDVDVEVQKSVMGNYNDTNNVKFKTIAPILMASATYKGSYEQITEVNEAVANWVRDHGYEFNGLSFCIYHVSPYDTSNPDELVTEVCYPVKEK